MKTSANAVPPGLSLYTFDYPDGHFSEDCFCGQHNPEQCHLEDDGAARRFAKQYGATSATHVLTGRTINL